MLNTIASPQSQGIPSPRYSASVGKSGIKQERASCWSTEVMAFHIFGEKNQDPGGMGLENIVPHRTERSTPRPDERSEGIEARC